MMPGRHLRRRHKVLSRTRVRLKSPRISRANTAFCLPVENGAALDLADDCTSALMLSEWLQGAY